MIYCDFILFIYFCKTFFLKISLWFLLWPIGCSGVCLMFMYLNFPVFFLIMISSFISLWSEMMLDMILIPLNLRLFLFCKTGTIWVQTMAWCSEQSLSTSPSDLLLCVCRRNASCIFFLTQHVRLSGLITLKQLIKMVY